MSTQGVTDELQAGPPALSSPRTSVTHVKKDFDVYIGREMPGHRGSVFSNPFKIGADGSRGEVIASYKAYLDKRLLLEPRLQEELQLLKGKRLGCWCWPQQCHGDVLVEMLEGPLIAESPAQTSLF
jgi:hypothetical protein